MSLDYDFDVYLQKKINFSIKNDRKWWTRPKICYIRLFLTVFLAVQNLFWAHSNLNVYVFGRKIEWRLRFWCYFVKMNTVLYQKWPKQVDVTKKSRFLGVFGLKIVVKNFIWVYKILNIHSFIRKIVIWLRFWRFFFKINESFDQKLAKMVKNRYFCYFLTVFWR